MVPPKGSHWSTTTGRGRGRGRGGSRGRGGTNTVEHETPSTRTRSGPRDTYRPSAAGEEYTIQPRRRQPATIVGSPYLQTTIQQASSTMPRPMLHSSASLHQPETHQRRIQPFTIPTPREAVRRIVRTERRPQGWQRLNPREITLYPPGSYRADGVVYSEEDPEYVPEEGRDFEETQRVILETPEQQEAERVHMVRRTIHEVYEDERHIVSRLNAMPPQETYPTSPATTSAQREYRIDTVRNIVRLPHLINRETLEDVLEASNWDVNDAAARLRRRDRIARLTDPQAPLFPGLPRYRERPRGANLNRGYGGTPVQTSRRAVMAALLVRLGFQPNAPLPHSNTTIVAFLHAHHWDLETAVEAYQVHGGNLDAYRQRGENLRSRNPTQYQQDQRLAEFISWVSIDSLHSAREHLIRHNWDVARAADQWVRLGFVPILRPRTGKPIWSPDTRGRRVVSVEYGPDNDNIYRHEDSVDDIEAYDFDAQTNKPDPNPSWANTATEQPDNVPNPSDYSGKHDRKGRATRRQGWVIDENRVPPRVNCPDPIKLREEVIERGVYRFRWYRPGLDTRGQSKQLFRWIDSDSEDEPNPHRGRPEFDWRQSVGHIKRLSQERNGFLLQLTNEQQRLSTVEYHPLELEWLWNAVNSEVERYAQSHGLQPVEHGRGLPPRFSGTVRAAWEADFNQRFQNQTVVDGVTLGSQPRPFRSGHSLMVQLSRTPRVIEDFLITRNEPHRPKPRRRGFGRGRAETEEPKSSEVETDTGSESPLFMSEEEFEDDHNAGDNFSSDSDDFFGEYDT